MLSPCMLIHLKAANRVFRWFKNQAQRQTPTGTKTTEAPSIRISDEGGSSPMGDKLNKGFLHRALCTEALFYTTLADMYLSQLLILLYALYCKSVRHFVCSCSCCDGKCIVQEAAERTYSFPYFPFDAHAWRGIRSVQLLLVCNFMAQELVEIIHEYFPLPQMWPREMCGPVHGECGSMPLMNRNGVAWAPPRVLC